MPVLIIDYHMCNLGSVRRAFEECGAEVIVSSHPDNLEIATHIVLPGVGSFAKRMKNLTIAQRYRYYGQKFQSLDMLTEFWTHHPVQS